MQPFLHLQGCFHRVCQVCPRRLRVLCYEEARHVLPTPPRPRNASPLSTYAVCVQRQPTRTRSLCCQHWSRLFGTLLSPRVVTAGAQTQTVSSAVTLLGLRYTSLTFGMKRSIEKIIQMELGADSVTATYEEADSRRQRGRLLAPGDTIVKWEAIFRSAAATSAVLRGSPQEFEQSLTARLNSNDGMRGVTAKSEPFASAGLSHRHSLHPLCTLPVSRATAPVPSVLLWSLHL